MLRQASPAERRLAVEERLQKILSAYGLCSRRTAETWLAEGRVTVNGRIANLGDKADPDRDDIRADGKPLKERSQRTYLLLNKPRGYVTTLSDEKGRKTVADLVKDCGVRVWPVGRLDLDSEGLLILTDDGELTQRLLHPSHEVEKEYLVWVKGDIPSALPVMRGPIELDGIRLSPARVEPVGDGILSVTIHEGRNRQVRRMCALAGLRVTRLRRVREGALTLGQLGPGCWRPLSRTEVAMLEQLPDQS